MLGCNVFTGYMLKEIKFIVLVIFMATVAFLSALIVNQFILNKMLKFNKVEITGSVKVKTKKKTLPKTARYIIKKNIFNSSLSFDENKATIEINQDEELPQEEQKSSGICEISKISVDIKATMPAEPKEYSYFAVYDSSTRKMKYYGLGDDFMENGVTVYDIKRSVVMLDRNGKKECLFLGKNGDKNNRGHSKSYSSTPTTGYSAALNRSGSRIDVKQTGENSYVIDADDLNKELKNLSRISREARGVFARDRNNPGKSLGFKLFAIKRGSLFEKIGIKNGDIIQTINGESLDNPDKALEMYSRLQDGISDLNVTILRHGKKINMDYSVR